MRYGLIIGMAVGMLAGGLVVSNSTKAREMLDKSQDVVVDKAVEVTKIVADKFSNTATDWQNGQQDTSNYH